MSKAILLFVSFSIFNFSFSQILKDRKEIQKDKINTVVEMWYRYDIDGNMMPQGSKNQFEVYDKEGKLIQKIKYIPSKGIQYKRQFKYNKKDQELGSLKQNADGKTIDKTKHTYNDKNQIIKTEGLLPENKYTKHLSYNHQGYLISKAKIDESGDTLLNYHFTYKDTLLVKEVFQNSSKTYETSYSYNTYNQKIEEVMLIDTSMNYRIKYTYFKNGRLKTEEKLDPLNRSLSLLSYTYDDSGNVKTIVQFSDFLGYMKNKWVYRYDGKGNVDEILQYDDAEGMPISKTKYVYRYYKD